MRQIQRKREAVEGLADLGDTSTFDFTGPRWEIVSEGNGVGDAVVHTDPAHRLLVLWGRRSMKRPLTIEADDATVPTVCSVLWPASVAWC
jgi:hypothetical protein